MVGNPHDRDVIELAAAQWVVRSQGDAVRESDILALTEWLEADDAHADAYRTALGLWYDAAPVATSTQSATVPSANVINLASARARKAPRRFIPWAAGGAVAAALALAVCLPLLTSAPVKETVYTTAKGERRSVTLADGTVAMLNTDTKLSVRLGKTSRDVSLDRGEVALQVVHDEKHPFTVTTGDVRLTDLGTEFAVLRQSDAVRVAVRSGSVSLLPTLTSGQAVTLRAGDTATHADGATVSRLAHGDSQTAFAWQTAHAIYRDQPLSDVVKDLNRYFDRPIIVDDETGKLRLTAILTLDSESSVVGRLEDFLSLEAHATDRGIVLGPRAGHGRHAS